MLAAVEKAGVIHAYGENMIYAPDFREILDIVAAGHDRQAACGSAAGRRISGRTRRGSGRRRNPAAARSSTWAAT